MTIRMLVDGGVPLGTMSPYIMDVFP